jgi:DNA repair protein RAD5
LGRILTEKPRLVRGGIIAEAMGLGKTVICLALILQNPAPSMPESGSQASTIPALDQLQDPTPSSFRDPDLYGRTSSTNAKRGSIVSHGTLVVCNVSLVGQWVEEAKSKLKNPGLVYSYYGQSRVRKAMMLANNAIVVTTYETLASDATYHANKSSDASYCAPCEQVRWWRIICDESHVLRNNNTAKAEAVMNLVGDNKWLVSGKWINHKFQPILTVSNLIGLC